MTLIDCEINKNYKVDKLFVGRGASCRLYDLGLTPNTPVKVINRGFGPIIVEVRGSRLVLGKGVASKVSVKQL